MKRALLAIGLMVMALLSTSASAQTSGEWRLVMKNYSYQLAHPEMTFFECVDQSAKDGLKYMEVKPAQKLGGDLTGDTDIIKWDKATMDKVQAKCKAAGVQLEGFGVARPKNEADAKQMFENCKALGITYVVMEPKAEELDMLDKLAQQYQIAIAIHNHPLPSIYWNPETVLNACKGHSKWIGACADTGHWMRSGLDPVKCMKELEGHIIMLHFKDVAPGEPSASNSANPAAATTEKAAKKGKGGKGGKNAKTAKADKKGGKKGKKAEAAPAGDSAEKSKPYHDVAWGTGDCNVPAMMAELKRQGFKGDFSIEYENRYTLDENLAKCVKFFNEHKDKSEAELAAEAKK